MNDLVDINRASKVLKAGGVVIFPTDTVWGIGASIQNLAGIKKLYQIKNRKRQPTAVLVSSLTQAKLLGDFNKTAIKLARVFWPGGLTIIVKAKKQVSKIICSKDNTIGLRMPNHQLLLKLIENLGEGIVAASANFRNQPTPVSFDQLDQRIKLLADFILTGKNLGLKASTVIDTTTKPPVIIRKGLISLKKLI